MARRVMTRTGVNALLAPIKQEDRRLLIRPMLEETARQRPERTAIIAGDVAISYGQLADQVARCAAGLLELGLAAGDRVAVLLPNTMEFATTLLAAHYAGLIAVPLFADYPPAEQRDILTQTAARVLIASPSLLPLVPDESIPALTRVILTGVEAPGCLTYEALLESPPLGASVDQDANGDPIAIIVYTSGSTGRPKGVAHTQTRLVNRADLFIQTLGITGSDRTLSAQHLGRPLFLVANLLAMLRVGGCLTLVDPPAPDRFWKCYGELQPTYYLAPPGYSYQLMDRPGAVQINHSRLRFWINVGDRPSAELRQRVTAITGRPFLNMFGMTESGFLAITSPTKPTKTDAIGKPMAGVEFQLVAPDGQEVAPGEAGRLRIRTPNLMVGYWNNTLLTHRTIGSGWLETQDLLRIDEDGDYGFVGRRSDIIVRNGANVATALVVESLLTHPAIAEAILVGMPDRCDGQLPMAFYRLRAAASDPGGAALHAWVAAAVDAWSIPAGFYPIDHWPLTPNGKIDRNRLIDMAVGLAAVAR
ncbi:MAG TPA: class I adenylate-forming enzyme family protein [Candidatus Contendobacter sp.]|nr:class I adenylate-forming enzyme family protein [Candidatus Contendobacter sp.]